MENKTWFEVYEIQEDNTTKTLCDFDTKKEALSFIFEYSTKYKEKKLYIDQWKVINGTPLPVKVVN